MASAGITANSKFARGDISKVQTVSLGLMIHQMVRRRLLDMIAQ